VSNAAQTYLQGMSPTRLFQRLKQGDVEDKNKSQKNVINVDLPCSIRPALQSVWQARHGSNSHHSSKV